MTKYASITPQKNARSDPTCTCIVRGLILESVPSFSRPLMALAPLKPVVATDLAELLNLTFPPKGPPREGPQEPVGPKKGSLLPLPLNAPPAHNGIHKGMVSQLVAPRPLSLGCLCGPRQGTD